MKKLAIILVFLLPGLSLMSGNDSGKDKTKTSSRTIAGKITDKKGESVAGAKIVIEETGETLFSDLDGNFHFTISARKNYCVCVNTIGFQPLKLNSSQLGSFSELTLTSL